MNLDETEFRAVARLLVKINPATKGMSVDDMLADMQGNAYHYMYDNIHFSTYGYVLTAYTNSGERYVRASLTAHVVERYFVSLKEQLQLVD